MVQTKNIDELDQILAKKFTNIFRKGYSTFDGTTMPIRYKEMKTSIDDFEISEEDVWICSYPKTGTTWTQEMVWMIMNGLDFKGGEVNLGERSPFLEVSALFDYRDMMENNGNFTPPPFIEDSLGFVKGQKGPLCIKTHLPLNLLPHKLQNGTKIPKIIYVTRNPKDTCNSYYHHCRLMEGYTGDYNEFCQLFLAGKLNFGPYWKHVLPFWARRHAPNVLFLKYEEMKKDLPAVIRQVAQFLQKPLNEEEVKILEKHLSFDSMKLNKAVNYEMIVELNRKFKLIECEGEFMRSGTVGNYKATMGKDLLEEFEDWEKKNLEETDYNC